MFLPPTFLFRRGVNLKNLSENTFLAKSNCTQILRPNIVGGYIEGVDSKESTWENRGVKIKVAFMRVGL
jgi:hypothetical protein